MVEWIYLLGLEPESNSPADRMLLLRLLEEYAAKNGDNTADHLDKIVYFDENGLRFSDDGNFDKLVMLYDSLNAIGQQKAIERVEELTEIPKYQR